MIDMISSWQSLNVKEFQSVMEKIGLGGDQNLIDKLFWVFDNDGNGEIDHKELIAGFEMLKQNSLEEKLNMFFELCDWNKSGTIDKKEFYEVIKESLIDYQDRADIK